MDLLGTLHDSPPTVSHPDTIEPFCTFACKNLPRNSPRELASTRNARPLFDRHRTQYEKHFCRAHQQKRRDTTRTDPPMITCNQHEPTEQQNTVTRPKKKSSDTEKKIRNQKTRTVVDFTRLLRFYTFTLASDSRAKTDEKN